MDYDEIFKEYTYYLVGDSVFFFCYLYLVVVSATLLKSGRVASGNIHLLIGY